MTSAAVPIHTPPIGTVVKNVKNARSVPKNARARRAAAASTDRDDLQSACIELRRPVGLDVQPAAMHVASTRGSRRAPARAPATRPQQDPDHAERELAVAAARARARSSPTVDERDRTAACDAIRDDRAPACIASGSRTPSDAAREHDRPVSPRDAAAADGSRGRDVRRRAIQQVALTRRTTVAERSRAGGDSRAGEAPLGCWLAVHGSATPAASAGTGSRRGSTPGRSAASRGDRCRCPRPPSAACRPRARGSSPRRSPWSRRRRPPWRATCAWNRARWSSGSLSSENPFASSLPLTNSSKRSQNARVRVVLARERRHRERELGEERRLDELGFGGGFEHEVPEVAGADRGAARDRA